MPSQKDTTLSRSIVKQSPHVAITHRPASDLLLETMGFKKAAQSTGGVVVSKVEADGWNTSDMAAEDLKPLLSWRDLKPRMIGRRYTHPPVEMF